MGELLFPMGAFLWVTADHLRCWDSPSQSVTAPAACWHLPMVAGVRLLQTPLQPPGGSAAGSGLLNAVPSLLFGPCGNSKSRINPTNSNSQLSTSVNWYILSDNSSHCCFWGNHPIPQNNHCAQSTPFSSSKKQLVSFQTQSFGRALPCLSLLPLLLVTLGITVIPRFC